MKKIERNEMTALFFFVEFLTVALLTGMFIIPITCDRDNNQGMLTQFWTIFLFFFLGALLILFFCFAAFTNPGYVLREKTIDF